MDFALLEIANDLVLFPASPGWKHRLDKLSSAHRAAQPVELGPAFGLHGDGARDGCAALGVGGFLALRATRSFARAAVGGLIQRLR